MSGADNVRVKVNPEACMGIGQCEMLEPDVFIVDDEGMAHVVEGSVVTNERALELIDRCPSGAISIDGNSADDSAGDASDAAG